MGGFIVKAILCIMYIWALCGLKMVSSMSLMSLCE